MGQRDSDITLAIECDGPRRTDWSGNLRTGSTTGRAAVTVTPMMVVTGPVRYSAYWVDDWPMCAGVVTFTPMMVVMSHVICDCRGPGRLRRFDVTQYTAFNSRRNSRR